jgi:peptidoglycan/xylan/chitin deacetylase (PgdA/CDA1 family)
MPGGRGINELCRGGAGRRMSPQGRARHLTRSHDGRRYPPARGPQELSRRFRLMTARWCWTFDDGPWPPRDQKILAALAQECVRATFFLIGKPASEHPELVRGIAAQDHTIAHHTWTHHNLKYMKAGDGDRRDLQGERSGRNGASRKGHHDPERAVLSLSYF